MRRKFPCHIGALIPILSAALGCLSVAPGCAQTQEKAPESTRAPAVTQEKEHLSDSDISAVIQAANLGEIEMGHLARTSAENESVRELANTLINDHSNANREHMDLVRKLNIMPKENDLSRELARDVKDIMSRLRDLKGTDFDREYVHAQVAMHRRVLDLIDDRLLPSVENRDLADHLRTIRPMFLTHLRESERIQQEAPVARR